MKKAVFKWFQIVLVKNKNAWKSTDFQAFESFVMLKCDPGGIRTHDPQLRRLLLYPAELRDHFSKKSFAKVRDFLQLSNTYRQKINQISHYLPKNE